MELAIGVAAALLGAGLGLAGKQESPWVDWVRVVALTTALAVVLGQLIPESLAAVGLPALGVVLVALVAPSLGERVLSSRRGPRIGLELGFAGLVIHKLGDGAALAAWSVGSHAGHVHFDLVAAIAAHTVPVVALVVFAFARSYGLRVAVWRAAALVMATVFGGVLVDALPPSLLRQAEPWITAVASGLLLHVVFHRVGPSEPSPAAASTAAPALGPTPWRRLGDLAAIAVGLGVLALGHAEHGHSIANDVRHDTAAAFVDLALETAPVLLLGLVLAAGLQVFGSRIRLGWLTRGSFFGQAVRGAVVGTPLPMCACGVLPLGASLRHRGVGAAAVVAFLIATPELGIETLLLTGKFLGWPFAFLRLAAAVGLAILAGVAFARWAPRPPTAAHSLDEGADPEASAPSFRQFLHQLDELVIHVGPWTVAGLVVAAYLQAVLAPQVIAAWGQGGLDVLVTAAVAVPSYVCAASATPMAAVLLAKGMSPGAILLGLLLGPATNVATVQFLRASYGDAATWRGLAVLVVASFGLAFAVNALRWSPQPLAVSLHGHDPSWGAWAAIGACGLLVARTVWSEGLGAWLGVPGSAGTHHHGHGHTRDHGHVHNHDHAHGREWAAH
jgi:hypothetical protein